VSTAVTRELNWADAPGGTTGVLATPDTATETIDRGRLVTTRGVTSISPTAVGRVVEHATAEVTGVEAVERSGLGRAGGRLDSKVSAEVDDTEVDLEVHIRVDYPLPLKQTVASVDRHLRERVGTLTGLHVRDLRIEVDDLVVRSRTGGPRVV
jgi:uncharacterized alkaline shock family protein YloU